MESLVVWRMGASGPFPNQKRLLRNLLAHHDDDRVIESIHRDGSAELLETTQLQPYFLQMPALSSSQNYLAAAIGDFDAPSDSYPWLLV